jgi:dTDP-4-amino-4,6-dideoxygalactose transaminase
VIPFNKPYLTGKETDYIKEAVASGKISGNGMFTKKCQSFLEQRYGFKKCLLTSSCTDALEMAAILLDITTGDEVIIPSYTFVSTANPFILRGATIVFADSLQSNPNIDAGKIEALITNKTKAIIVVHYAGVACDMDAIMEIAARHHLFVVEDAAQAIDSYYTGGDGWKRALGSIGHMAAFSFHETKNIISGEGGMLVINDDRFTARSEIIWEKGTNRAAFFRGEVDKYGWADIGSSFLPSEIVAAFLYAQLEHLDEIQAQRIHCWNLYHEALRPMEQLGCIKLPFVPSFACNNAHIFYILFPGIKERDQCIQYLKEQDVHPVFHYLSLHASPYYADKHDGRALPYSDYYSASLLRLPMYFELCDADISSICGLIKEYCDGDQ